MNPKNMDFRKQAMLWEALSAMVAFLLIIYLIGDRFKATSGILPDMNLTQQLSVFFLSMLSPIFWVSLIAPISYASVAIAAVSVFRAIGKGDDFSPAMLKGLQSMGSNLIYGSIGAMLITPCLTNWLNQNVGFKFNSSAEGFVILIVGGALYFLADIGKKMNAELESFV